MRFRTVLYLASLSLVCMAAATWSVPLPAHTTPRHLLASPDSQSLSGKIANVGDAAFSLEVKKDQDVSTVVFLVDDNTKIEGKLAVGARATVEYRSSDGKNIAIRVIVSPSAKIGLY